MRSLLVLIAIIAGLSLAPGSADPQTPAPPDPPLIVTLLGTGTPQLFEDRFGPSILVQAAGLNLVFDAGRGASVRLAQAGVSLGRVDAVFLTHFHSDHLNGLADLWMTGYIPSSGRRAPLPLHGPTGTAALAAGLMSTYALDAKIRIADEAVPVEGTRIEPHEFARDGVVFERAGVKVTAFAVDHGELIKPAFGYRIDYGRRSVVLSGDTRLDANLAARAAGADLIVHEVAVAPKAIEAQPSVVRVMNHHTSPEEAGRLFAQARPKLAIYSHIVRLGPPATQPVGLPEIVERTRQTYAGPLVIGEDLMRFEVADAVTVIPLYSGR